MELLAAISDSAFPTWVRESGSLFAYPMFILLHTIGLAIVVGLSSIVSLMILSTAPDTILVATRPLFRYLWAGFALNAGSGVVLMLADAPTMVMNPVMWVKFVFIITVVLLMRHAQRGIAAGAAMLRRPGRPIAAATLLCWLGAIVTGRLTAYLGPVAGLLGE